MLQTIGTKPVDFAFVLPENNDAIDIYPRYQLIAEWRYIRSALTVFGLDV